MIVGMFGNNRFVMNRKAISRMQVAANYHLGRLLVGFGAAAMLHLDIVKKAPIPDGPVIIAANHPTTTDPGLLTLLSKEPMAILIAETLYKVPVLGRYLKKAGHITVIPGHGKHALEQAADVIASGRNIGIFTEGSLSPEFGGYMPPKTGTARLALISGVPVIPVGIHLNNSHVRFLKTKVEGKSEISRWCLNGPYAMTVGEPMYLSGSIDDWSEVRSLSNNIMNRIISLAQLSQSRIEMSDFATLNWLSNLWTQSFSDELSCLQSTS